MLSGKHAAAELIMEEALLAQFNPARHQNYGATIAVATTTTAHFTVWVLFYGPQKL